MYSLKAIKRLFVLTIVLFLLPVFGVNTKIAAAADKQIKNIIYMIPDGGGFPLFDMADEVKKAGGFNSNPYGAAITQNNMYMKDFLYGTVETSMADPWTTDSAAAGTALATGYKTNQGVLGFDTNRVPHASILEAAKLMGKTTGVVVTTGFYDATPASFASKANSRHDQETILRQMLSQQLDFVIGDSSYLSRQEIIDAGYTPVSDKYDLMNASPYDRLWAHEMWFPFDIWTNDYDSNLLETVQTVIGLIERQNNDNGFFLMIEGSKVDHGGHANDAVLTTSDYIAFDESFKYVVEWAKQRDDTIVVAVPDHDTGGLIMPSNPADLADAVAQIQDTQNPPTTLVDWESPNHTDADVGIWIYAPSGVALPSGVAATPNNVANRNGYLISNTNIPKYLMSLISDETLDQITAELYIDISQYGEHDGETFSFDAQYGNATIKANESTAMIDGQAFSLDGQIAVLGDWDNTFYAPQSLIDRVVLGIEPSAHPTLSPTCGGGNQFQCLYMANEGESFVIDGSIPADSNAPTPFKVCVTLADAKQKTYLICDTFTSTSAPSNFTFNIPTSSLPGTSDLFLSTKLKTTNLATGKTHSDSTSFTLFVKRTHSGAITQESRNFINSNNPNFN